MIPSRSLEARLGEIQRPNFSCRNDGERIWRRGGKRPEIGLEIFSHRW